MTDDRIRVSPKAVEPYGEAFTLAESRKKHWTCGDMECGAAPIVIQDRVHGWIVRCPFSLDHPLEKRQYRATIGETLLDYDTDAERRREGRDVAKDYEFDNTELDRIADLFA